MLDKTITSYLPIIWSMFHIFPNICVAFYYAHVIPVRCMYPDSRIESDFAHCYFPPALILVLLVVQSVSPVWLFVTSWTAAYQASLSFIISWSLLKLMYIELVMPPNHLVLYCPPSPPVFNLSQHQGLFQWVSSSHQVAEVLEFQI